MECYSFYDCYIATRGFNELKIMFYISIMPGKRIHILFSDKVWLQVTSNLGLNERNNVFCSLNNYEIKSNNTTLFCIPSPKGIVKIFSGRYVYVLNAPNKLESVKIG